ncbi:jg28004 [Pararge aegeria aegeria]|uniref:Jg28004 protein n=1 Tax=Pararge aegeria aegeria TaxID=348720 RepID=A0A8S4QZ17_9NEOP|nr:jg28004 [Pararge aegeria aegeria]
MSMVTDSTSPDEVCHKKQSTRLCSIVQARILTFFGHISVRDNDSIERLVVQGGIEGTRSRGRSPMRWADQIKPIRQPIGAVGSDPAF